MAKRKIPSRRVKGKTRSRAVKGKLPPPDNPLLRHEELHADRRIEGEKAIVEGAAMKAALAAASGKRPARAAKEKPQESTRRRVAKLRLAALQESRRMNQRDLGGPTIARRRAISATDPGVIEMVPVTPGISGCRWDRRRFPKDRLTRLRACS